MSFAGARANVATELASVTWTVPSSAANLPILGTKTQFDSASIVTYLPQKEFNPNQLPIARVHIPRLQETRKTSGSDLVAQKLQTIRAQVFVYLIWERRDGPGVSDFFDAVMDGVLAWFRQHSGGGGTPSQGNNDLLVSYGLDQEATIDMIDAPLEDSNKVQYRGTVNVTLQMSIV